MQFLKKTIRCIAFLSGLVVFLYTMSFVFSPKDNRKEFGMHDQVLKGILTEKKDSIDIIVLGDSETYCSFSPMQLWRDCGYTSYICGTSGQTLDNSYNYLKLVLETQTPKLVILETNAAYRSDGIQTDVINALTKTAEIIMPVFEYHNRWKSLSSYDFCKSPEYTWKNDMKGFSYIKKVDAWKGDEYMKETDISLPIPTMPRFYLEQMTALCKERGIEFLLVDVPSPVNWNYKKHKGVQLFADENGLAFLDLNLKTNELGIDWNKDSLDKGDHMNYSGAQKVTAYLGEYLKMNYTLIDHRVEKSFNTWNESLKIYEKTVQEST